MGRRRGHSDGDDAHRRDTAAPDGARRYVDRTCRCPDCGRSYVHSVAERRARHEILGLPLGETPSACPPCLDALTRR